ncbi:MAG: CoA transferase, partial [Halioglobus sp.]|nr:CoA transferase [Halioglobus sp.]
GAGQFPTTGRRGQRMGASMGATREIWPCADGFVSFGLRGGPSRAHNFDILLAQMGRDRINTASWEGRDWLRFNAAALTAEELADIERPLSEFFALHSMTDLYDLAVATNLMLAPANGAAEIIAGTQLAARNFFTALDGSAALPARFAIRRGATGGDDGNEAPGPAPVLGAGPVPHWPAIPTSTPSRQRPWADLKLLEFGSGAAGPIASRYFVEQGATVVKVESTKHPDFLRVMSRTEEHGLESSSLFNALNPGKHSVTLNLRNEQGIRLARELLHWADAVIENFAPRAMRKYGLDYTSMITEKPDLVMLSTCLNGQTGPHRDYPGFGGQGAALCGFNYLTGWPDREPIGPFGTITDSLSPRFAAAALAASLLHHRRTGEGAYIDLAQVETGAYSLAPWLLEYGINGCDSTRRGNRHGATAPHGVFPCAGEDRWIAIACWSDEDWLQLALLAGMDSDAYPSLEARLDDSEAIEEHLAQYTRNQDALKLARTLQDLGVEAVPVADFGDLYEDTEQLAAREHFVALERPRTGQFHYERNGYRLENDSGGYATPTPLLGEHTEQVLMRQLGYSADQVAVFRDNGALD